MITISELHIYPIKSLGGISVTEAVVEAKGLRFDRRFMLVSPDGQFITQRANQQMALIDVAIEGTQLRVWHRNQPDNVLELPLLPADRPHDQETMQVSIWDSHNVPAVTVGEHADQWFSNALGQLCRLVFMPESTHRTVDPRYARQHDAVSFADGYPYLLIGESSLDELNRRLPSSHEHPAQPLSMIRFRPNIVVKGSDPYDEDTWAHFRINDIDFYGVKPCARCVLTTIDPATGHKGKEPLRTLATYRHWNNKILFGQNVLAEAMTAGTLGALRIGQTVEILHRQEPWLAPPVSVF
ncbi:MOSC N-terminal beta barrel domain-containing protein [Spirosoma sp. SC4-14]|uniref:MOSC domain-containing protein n=1 Tax=Spirosoma sp. SC4-14 TaxID=3128900 RepID=UPI0030CB13C1